MHEKNEDIFNVTHKSYNRVWIHFLMCVFLGFFPVANQLEREREEVWILD